GYSDTSSSESNRHFARASSASSLVTSSRPSRRSKSDSPEGDSSLSIRRRGRSFSGLRCMDLPQLGYCNEVSEALWVFRELPNTPGQGCQDPLPRLEQTRSLGQGSAQSVHI